MSYEYKALIEQAIIDDDRPLDWEEGFKELDEVYARAQAFDEVIKKHEAIIERCDKKLERIDLNLDKQNLLYVMIDFSEDVINELKSQLP